MIQTEPASVRPPGSACGAPNAKSGTPSPVTSPTRRDALADVLVVEHRVVDVEVVGVAGLPEVGEVDVHARRACRRAPPRRRRPGGAGRRPACRSRRSLRPALAVPAFVLPTLTSGITASDMPVCELSMEAVVAAAERRLRRGVRGVVRVARGRERRRVEIGRMRLAVDDVDGAAVALGRRPGHRRADRDVGEAVAVEIAAGDREAEQLAAVADDAERGRREVERGRRRRRRAGLAEEDVDDARVGAVGIGVGHADRVVVEVVAVDVAEHRRRSCASRRRS